MTALPSTARSLRRPAGNASALAPGPRRQALDLPAWPTRSAGHPDGDRRTHPAVSEGEPDVGLPTYPRRDSAHGHHHRTFERLGDPEASRHRAVATQVRTYRGRVPLHAGEGTHRVRLLPCRCGSPPPALRARVHPPRHAARTARRRDRQAGRELGDPSTPSSPSTSSTTTRTDRTARSASMRRLRSTRLRRRSRTSTPPVYEEPTVWAASSTSTGWSPELGGWDSRHPHHADSGPAQDAK